MTEREILSRVDHTLLSAAASWEQIKTLCDESIEYQTASVCIPQTYVGRVKERYGESVVICTVIGFPLGYNCTESKITEAAKALEDGAAEIDMVIDITDAKNNDFAKIEGEISRIRDAARGRILKVIIETCYLSDDEKASACRAATNAGADYVKTSTGFAPGGATIPDVLLMRKHIGPNVKIKAAGGIRTIRDMEAFIENGCDRLGTSQAVKLFRELRTAS
jgi:deoxyribose-phosphate aldolase